MATQQKALQEICRAVWRLTLTGTHNIPVPSVGCRRTLQCKILDQQTPAKPSDPSTTGMNLNTMVSRKTSLVLRTRPVLTSQLGIQRDVCKYILPPQVFLSYNDQVVFGDVPSSSSVYDCPNTHTHCHIIDPILSRLPIEIKVPECSQTNSPKQARQILKIRRKKMKRHLLKKYRKRMMFTLRKQRRERRRKKEAIFLAKLVKIKQWGESFSARDYVLQELNKARRGGFYINVLAKK